jgi:hypothetical protein
VFSLGTDFTGTIIGDYGNGSGYIRVESNTGPPNFTPSPISTRFYNFLATLTAGTEFTVNTVVEGTTYNTVVSFTEFSGGNPVAPNRNDLYYTFVSGDTLPFSYDATALTLTFEGSTFSFTTSAVTFPDGTVQTTAYPGVTTVAKDGPTLPTTTGVVDTLIHDSVLSGLLSATYGPFTRSGVTFSVVVFGGVIGGFSAVSGTATVNDVLGTIDSGDIGGTAGTTITITVDSVVQATPVAIDLTRTVNKLADGAYTLADGVEGQIMYVVRQNGSTAANISVVVANARWDGLVYSDQPVIPFQIPFTDMVTIIFTDGAWQSSTFGSLT